MRRTAGAISRVFKTTIPLRDKDKLTDIHCSGCHTFLGRRLGNRLIAYGLDIVFSRTGPITCHKCGVDTLFHVDRYCKPVRNILTEKS